MLLQKPRSDKRDALYTALIKARDKFNILEKDKNGARGGKYSTWEDICAALVVKQSLLPTGIWLSYELERDETGEFWFILKVEHVETGQYDTSKVQYIASNKYGDEMQCNGAAFTYALKQVTRNFFALAAGGEDDPDGQPIEEPKDTNEEPTKNNETKKITDNESAIMKETLNSFKNATKLYNDVLGFNKIKLMSELPQSKFSNAMKYIREKGEK